MTTIAGHQPAALRPGALGVIGEVVLSVPGLAWALDFHGARVPMEDGFCLWGPAPQPGLVLNAEAAR